MADWTAYPKCLDGFPGQPCIVEEAQGVILYPEYKPCAHSSFLLPGFNLMSQWFLALVYGLALVWCFFGVAIISDIFMSAIEVITSAEKTVKRKNRHGVETEISVLVWNPTVANLTLMALGSSAPEIMLAAIETIINLGQTPGELGPSTIVGSAAYNLFMISAVCIVSIPGDEIRKISDFPVFVCTALFSLWAYLWMLIVYVIWTPSEITLVEAGLTLLYLPIMVGLAYLIDARPWIQHASDPGEEPGDGAGYQRLVGAEVEMADGKHMHITKHEIEATVNPMMQAASQEMVAESRRTLSLTASDVVKCIQAVDGDDVDAMKQAAMDLVQQNQKPMTSIQYKINARKALAGSPHLGAVLATNYTPSTVVPESHAGTSRSAIGTVTFGATAYTCTETEGRIKLQVICERFAQYKQEIVRVTYCTRDGQAIGGMQQMMDADYESTSGELVFQPGESIKEVYVNILEDDVEEGVEGFYVDLLPVDGCEVQLLRSTANVIVTDSTSAGRVMFTESSIEAPHLSKYVLVPVERKMGCEGDVSVCYKTVNGTATAGVNFQEVVGTLTFAAGEKQKDIRIPVLKGAADTQFQLLLSNPENTALNERKAICDIYFTTDEKFGLVMRMIKGIMQRQDKVLSSSNSWLSQFKEAIVPGGDVSLDGEPAEELEFTDYILHYISFSWKVIFATVPPPEYWSGGPCFVVSVLYIGGVTYIVGELASCFGCAVSLPDAVTAFSFVALGTSLPDTFASRQAAQESPDADAAIGNVTGSNSVNVFLGLGIPWLIAAVYSSLKGVVYYAPPGALSFSVTVYMCCSAIAFFILVTKRILSGGELGGKGFMRTGFATILGSLWLVYLTLSGMQAVGHIESF
eukprot:jgi/Ulvmu1/7056/UM033_0116.1